MILDCAAVRRENANGLLCGRPFDYGCKDQVSLSGRLRAELVEGADQFAGDLLCCRLLDDVALHQVDQLAVAQNRHCRRGRRLAFEVAPRTRRSLGVLTGKDCDLALGLVGRVGQRQAHARSHLAGGATTDGVHYEKRCAGLRESCINVLSSTGFFDPGAHKLLTHGNYHNFWVHVTSGKDLAVLSRLPVFILQKTWRIDAAGRRAAPWCTLGSMLVEENRPLAPLTTLGIGGPARWFVEATTEQDIVEAATWTQGKNVPLFVLGGGSNLLAADAGFSGLVLHVALKGIHVRESSLHSAGWVYEVAAGEEWDECVRRTVEDNCAGLECLAGIPGTVGGTPVQNVGAYGQEVAPVIERVRVFALGEGVFAELSAAECGFAYRRSRFNTSDKGRYVVTRVDYCLLPGGAATLKYADLQRVFPPGSNPTLKEVAEAVRRIRQSKGMLLVDGDPDCRSAGSFFKNPIVSEEQAVDVASAAGAEPPRFPAGSGNEGCVKLSAAWLIEQAGFTRGYALGRAGISHKHTLALINLGGATAVEILALAERIRSIVAARFGVELQMEPMMLGF